MNDIKKELRRQIRAELNNLSFENGKTLDARLICNLLGNNLYKECNRIFLYASVGREIDTRDLIRIAYEKHGKKIALPKCKSDGIMEFYPYDGELIEGKYHIPEPFETEVVYPQPLDIMIVPGLAFNKFGYRIGQGGGYYDRYLERYPCITIGLCREQFLMEEIPTMWNDIPVDYVITENATYNCKKRSFD